MTATYNQPDVTSDTASEYKANIDASTKVMSEVAANFAPHEASTPDMTAVVDSGKMLIGGTLTTKSQQTTSAITAPSTNDRIDRIVLSRDDGTISVITGSEAASPTAPSFSNTQITVCQIYLTPSTTEIVNSDITDERPLLFQGPVDSVISDDTVTPGSDADVTLTSAQASNNRIIFATGSWGSGHNVEFPSGTSYAVWFDNTSSYNATLKVTGGSDTLTVPAGTSRPVVTDGSEVVDPLSYFSGYKSTQVFTSGGTWNKPAGLKRARVTVVGAGGGGGGSTTTNYRIGAGGAGGGASIETLDESALGSTETVTVGSGGSGGSASSDGSGGGTSSFGAHCSATGGGGGIQASVGNANSGGIGSGGDINLRGGPGGPPKSWSSETFGAGGIGGNSLLGGGAPSVSVATAGATADGPGGGGGGGNNQTGGVGQAGGDGADGIVIVEEFF